MEENALNWKQLVVRVFAKIGDTEKYCGTAFLINDEYLLTARHVIEPYRSGFNQNRDQIRLKNGPWTGIQFLAQAPIPHDNNLIDIALLQLRTANSTAVNYYPLDTNLSIGQWISIAGFEDENIEASSPSFEVLAERPQHYSFALQNKGQHGKSGSPVILNHKIVGIFHSRTDASDSKQDQNESFIYPVKVFRDFLKSNGVILPRQDNNEQPILPPHCYPDYLKRAYINRNVEWKHIYERIAYYRNRKTFAFIVAAVWREYPEAFKDRFLHALQLRRTYLLDSLNLKTAKNSSDWEELFQRALFDNLNQNNDRKNDDYNQIEIQNELIVQLSKSETSLFYWSLTSEISENLECIKTIVRHWESLQLSKPQNKHFLLIIYAEEKGFLNRGEKKVKKWYKSLLEEFTPDDPPDVPKVILPFLESPKKSDALHWSSNHLQGQRRIDFRKKIERKIRTHIPYTELLDIYNETKEPKTP